MAKNQRNPHYQEQSKAKLTPPGRRPPTPTQVSPGSSKGSRQAPADELEEDQYDDEDFDNTIDDEFEDAAEDEFDEPTNDQGTEHDEFDDEDGDEPDEDEEVESDSCGKPTIRSAGSLIDELFEQLAIRVSDMVVDRVAKMFQDKIAEETARTSGSKRGPQPAAKQPAAKQRTGRPVEQPAVNEDDDDF